MYFDDEDNKKDDELTDFDLIMLEELDGEDLIDIENSDEDVFDD